MREAAIKARDALLVEDPLSPDNRLLRLSSISRAVWQQDYKLAGILTKESELGRSHLLVGSDGISLRDPSGFEECFRSAKEQHLGRERAQIIQEGGGGEGVSLREHKKKSKLRVNSSLAELWVPKSPKLCIHGFRLSDAEAVACGVGAKGEEEVIVRDGEGQCKALATVWGRIFGERYESDRDDCDFFLADYQRQVGWSWADAIPPSIDSGTAYLGALKPCSAGRDGIVNAAWKHGGPHASRYIHDLLVAHTHNLPRPIDINDGLFVFIPKAVAEVDQDEQAIIVRPLETRPLTLKNEDNKCVAGLVNWGISPTVRRCASKVQRGFVNGRQLVQNVVDLDFASRAGALRYQASIDGYSFQNDLSIVRDGCVGALPVLALFDFASAFPSVAHMWLRAVLVCICVPTGVLCAFDALYANNEAYWPNGGMTTWLFKVVSGVLQGCPLSGSLFVLAIDPLLVMFERHVVQPGFGIVAACADDIGAFLDRLEHLPKVQELFRKFEGASGLALKPIKCVIVPAAVACSAENSRRIKQWLSIHCQGWDFFRIDPAGKYLGFYLGPGPSDELKDPCFGSSEPGGITSKRENNSSYQWAGPLAKFKARVQDIGQQGLPLPLCAARFNSRAVTVLGYVAQLVPLPHGFASIELAAGSKVLGFAPSSLNTGAVFSLDRWGGLKLVQPSLYALASRIRAALRTFKGYEAQHDELARLAMEALPIARALKGCTTPLGWSSEAFCTVLTKTSQLQELGCSAAQLQALQGIVQDYRNGKLQKKLQGKLFNALHSCRPDTWSPLLAQRSVTLREWSPGSDGLEVMAQPISSQPAWTLSAAFCDEWAQVSRHLQGQVVMTVLKTWANAWCTTRRYHEDICWPCIFGCTGAPDTLSHYLSCSRFWSGVLTSCKLSEFHAHADPLIKCCLCRPTPTRAKVIAVASRSYHAIKFVHREMVQSCIDSGDFSLCMLTLFQVSAHFAAELGVT